jgi:hypothetical protein
MSSQPLAAKKPGTGEPDSMACARDDCDPTVQAGAIFGSDLPYRFVHMQSSHTKTQRHEVKVLYPNAEQILLGVSIYSQRPSGTPNDLAGHNS